MSARNTQWLLLGGALVLFVLLFIAPRTTAFDKEKGTVADVSKNDPGSAANVEVYVSTAVKNLGTEKSKKYSSLKDLNVNDSLAAFWDSEKRPDLAALFVESVAKQKNTAEAWKKAGNRYYYAVQFTADKTEVPILYQSAIRCFSKAIGMDVNDTDSRIMLASCYVEGSSDPMKGITMMREIEKTDSTNVKLNLNLAFFSVKSGQLDKAITRFNKVLRKDSTYIEAYLHLADVYEQKQDTENTIVMLQKYAAKTHEATAKAEINRYIEQLKGNKVN